MVKTQKATGARWLCERAGGLVGHMARSVISAITHRQQQTHLQYCSHTAGGRNGRGGSLSHAMALTHVSFSDEKILF